MSLYEIGVTIAGGKPPDRRGGTVAYVKSFQVTSNSPNLPEPEDFTIRAVVDDQHGSVTTAYIEDPPSADSQTFDDCHFDGLDLC